MITRLAFLTRVHHVHGYGYEDAYADGYRNSELYSGVPVIDDYINVARPRHGPVMLPVFYRPSPLAGMNMVVMHQMVDSMYYITDGWQLLAEQSMVKLYHRDAVLDTVFPDLRASGAFDQERFRLLFDCLQAHFDSLYAPRDPGYPVVTHDDLDGGTGAFHDKPFRDLVRHHAWLSPDSVVVQLYCFPADVLKKYVLMEPGIHSYLLDSTTFTYKRMYKETPGAHVFVHDIQWEDLAIWIVYTHIGQKARTPYEP